jgi:hypothetical protein
VVRRHADVLSCWDDAVRAVSGLATFAQRHNDQDRGRDPQHETRR